ncbi:ABC-2 type transport system permease protein [Bacillus mesophilus]|uniref:ABC transporter permease n=1 Tax=Bacillus mesophilus TaxID=1808955 RepID=A0A6M0Q349_9BACI|nr:ABC transporter permease [Bacillus mesophilus]MBM7659940.1 ABC-2 type transport system permease protein [Bacillus mesophilus]NEY70801.1 ABC transporter permease [Bacillus mesophilus]
MNKFWIILLHTYLNKLKSKSFIITTAVTAVLILGLSNFENIIKVFDKEEGKRVAVIDESGELFPILQQQILLIDQELELDLYDGTIQEAETDVQNGQFEGVLVLAYNDTGLPEAVYKANSIANSLESLNLQQSLQQVKISIATSQIGLSDAEIQQLYEPVLFEMVALEENAKTEEELNSARGLVYIILFMIYIAVIMYANMIAMEVATEKSSRVMEILISSVSPVTQMFGKILGIALLSMTQFSILLLIGYQSIKMNLSNMESGMFQFLGFTHLPVSTIVYAIVFFLLGYFLFATLAAVLGSLVSRIEDVQQMITPMTLLIVIAFMIAMFGLGNPENTFITVTSFIPFFTPMIMFLRVGMLNVPVWEVALGIGILGGTIILLALVGAKVYKGGVLLYGKSSSFKDIKRAINVTKK